MFTRPRLYHPYKPSTPLRSPAGIRIADYIKPGRCFNLFGEADTSPAPSPLDSPPKGPHHYDGNAPPTLRLADLFAKDGLGPMRPPTPAPDNPRHAIPKGAHAPFLNPFRRKDKHGPKHLSFNKDAARPGVFPPHRRAQQTQDKRDAGYKKHHERHERRLARARDSLSKLHRQAEALMTPKHMNTEDKIFLRQLEKLAFSDALAHDLERCRERIARAAAEVDQRRQEHEERDRHVATMWGERQDAETSEEQKRAVAEFVKAEDDRVAAHFQRMEEAAIRADEERRRAHEARERQIREEQERLFRQELACKAWEEEMRQRRAERERQRREEKERQQREEMQRRQQAEEDRRLREELARKLREEIERQRRYEQFVREEKERLAREERERQARFFARRVAEQEEQVRQYFGVYEAKWNELRTNDALPPIDVREMPWPVFALVASAEQITHQDVRAFLFHPQRPGVEGKTARDKVKSEILRFHPDKFNTRILPKVRPSQQVVAQAIAGAVARILTRIMTEEVEEQN